MTHNGIKVHIDGKVQGVGFRPYVWQLAQALNLCGTVENSGEGVIIYVWQGQEMGDQADRVVEFIERLPKECPPLAKVLVLETFPYTWQIQPKEFQIVHSSAGEVKTHIIPDAATCSVCLAEMNDHANRRYSYPFTNCTHCGPRFSIVERIPYDRKNTSMKVFPMCSACQTEYENPADRRFHAQPNACPVCGPHVFFFDVNGHATAYEDEAVQQAVQMLLAGGIVAIKGVGGFHLACDATNVSAVSLLRQRKSRPTKPLAVMLPNLSWLKKCSATPVGEELALLLEGSVAPIVLVASKSNSVLAANIAPSLSEVGVMLPANPLQHWLLQQVRRPLVMTSGNPKGKPPALTNEQALQELNGIADGWLMHNRDIVQRVDDSVVRYHEGCGRQSVEVLRRARGYVPDAQQLPQGFQDNKAILAMGADLKNTFCILRKDHAVMSQHFGDLEDVKIQAQLEQGIALFQDIYQFNPDCVVADAHPNYISHQLGQKIASDLEVPMIKVLHHHAHLVSCMAEHRLDLDHPPVIGLALDGLGYGEQHQLWGGECLLVDYATCEHLGGLPPVALVGGNLASRQPWRNLLAHLQQFVPNWQTLPEAKHIPKENINTLTAMIERNLNAPMASSAGRLFDAVAAALGIVSQTLSWEGEAACNLEALAKNSHLHHQVEDISDIPVVMPAVLSNTTSKLTIDLETFWSSWLNWHASAEDRAFIFHYAFAKGFADLAIQAAQKYHTNTIVLSGGVFHNALLRRLFLLHLCDYQVLFPECVPAGDGGIALGQALIAQARTMRHHC